ncbi:MAG: 3-phosphoshikimate 1-carboxyvinyltransferase [Syntrophobacteraceae bacterium]
MSKTIRKIDPVPKVNAEIRLPGSKSVSHRALIVAALADGESEIRNLLEAEDTLLTMRALEMLGVRFVREENLVRVFPPESRWVQPSGPILLGNSGTSTRLLLAVAAAGKGTFTFDGSPRLRERPIGPVIEALEQLGVRCRYLGRPGFPPVEITSGGLEGGDVLVDASRSSQFLSAVLIAAPLARREVRVSWKEPVASFPYVAITLAMMETAGVETRRAGGNCIAVPAPAAYRPLRFTVEGDCSSASYFWAAAALTAGEVTTYPVFPDSSQGDCRLLDILQHMGCSVVMGQESVWVNGPEELKAVDVDMNGMPDVVPTLAVVAAFAPGTTRIRNVAHLRLKESDRLRAVATELRKFGVPVRELPDGLEIEGGSVHPPWAGIEVYNDHRIAMAFALAGLRVEGVEIHGAEAVSKSFPNFWEAFEQLKGPNA